MPSHQVRLRVSQGRSANTLRRSTFSRQVGQVSCAQQLPLNLSRVPHMHVSMAILLPLHMHISTAPPYSSQMLVRMLAFSERPSHSAHGLPRMRMPCTASIMSLGFARSAGTQQRRCAPSSPQWPSRVCTGRGRRACKPAARSSRAASRAASRRLPPALILCPRPNRLGHLHVATVFKQEPHHHSVLAASVQAICSRLVSARCRLASMTTPSTAACRAAVSA